MTTPHPIELELQRPAPRLLRRRADAPEQQPVRTLVFYLPFVAIGLLGLYLAKFAVIWFGTPAGHVHTDPDQRSSLPGAILVLLFAVGWNGLLLQTLWTKLGQLLRTRRLVSQGQPVAGHIFDKKRFGSEEDVETVYQVSYQYAPYGDPAAALLRGMMDVRKAQFDRFEIGDAVTVLHESRRPKISLIYAFVDYVAVLETEKNSG